MPGAVDEGGWAHQKPCWRACTAPTVCWPPCLNAPGPVAATFRTSLLAAIVGVHAHQGTPGTPSPGGAEGNRRAGVRCHWGVTTAFALWASKAAAALGIAEPWT